MNVIICNLQKSNFMITIINITNISVLSHIYVIFMLCFPPRLRAPLIRLLRRHLPPKGKSFLPPTVIQNEVKNPLLRCLRSMGTRFCAFCPLRGDSYCGYALCAASSKYFRKRVSFLASGAPLRSARNDVEPQPSRLASSAPSHASRPCAWSAILRAYAKLPAHTCAHTTPWCCA